MTFVDRRLAKRTLVTAGCLVLLLSMTACNQSVQVVVADKAADEAAIHHVLDEIARTFNAGDYDGMFAQYADDVVMKMRFDTQELEIGATWPMSAAPFSSKQRIPRPTRSHR